ncbi:hypothetical protein [Candidatus Spongiihabitans sp.]|uniref:hypothetical protein n=1 Tax=Candidatus Spongiihabitans sp. TaxID=3101308 RepID=UPI003C7BD565
MIKSIAIIAMDGMVDTRSLRYRHFRLPWRSADICSRQNLHFHRPWRSLSRAQDAQERPPLPRINPE